MRARDRFGLRIGVRWTVLGVIGTVAAFFVDSSRGNAQESMSGEQIYQVSCASCHGPSLRGGLAQSLVDAVWQFGSKKSHMIRNVKYGIADFSMPAFELALSDDQIESVVDYVLQAEKASGATRPPPPETLHSLDYQIRVEVYADDLDIPWGITFLDSRRALITERSGQLRLVENGVLDARPIAGIPAVVAEGQGGLLDVAADPEFARNGWIYLAYSHALESSPGRNRPPAMTRLVRGRIQDHAWVDQQVIYEAPHALYSETRHHYGCRIVFDPEGYLYFGVGDRGAGPQAQDLARPNGKIHRIHRDGAIPPGNPFAARADALPTIFTYGNRNPQGLAVHPVTGRVWESEHGPMGGDELNLLAAGRNYGWPEITYGRNYDGGIVSRYRSKPGMELPNLYWKPSIAVCGIDFVTGDLFPLWRNRLLVGALKYEEVRLVETDGDRVIHQEIVMKNAGRVRDVACGPDGAVYVVLNGPDMVLRWTPIRDLNEVPGG